MIELAVSLDDDNRKALMRGTVNGWPASERQSLSDSMSDLLSARAVKVQTEAIATHERGEDYSAGATELQRIVDMTVQVKVLVRDLKKLDLEGDA